ncbi:hypothetical protein C4D60_Mb06t19260 [Musa balbisiana]|uniref:UspA domain-containing protein n=1 Tax=Musa balbisiana TaxID=52838 RepID=A0A4S8IP46_MUSBA|nr:hypothetical protein C4D60_Mb06t19260 [Musa balbisiana]
MEAQETPPKSDRQGRPPAIEPSSPRFFLSAAAAASPGSHSRIAIAVDLSDESANAVKWAVQNYLRPGDAVVLLHVRPTGVLTAMIGAPSIFPSPPPPSTTRDRRCRRRSWRRTSTPSRPPRRSHLSSSRSTLSRDMCHEIKRLGLSAVIMGSRGFGASRRSSKSRLGSVSDYCVHHCVCPVVVVRYPDDGAGSDASGAGGLLAAPRVNGSALPVEEVELPPAPEEEQAYHDAVDEHKG